MVDFARTKVFRIAERKGGGYRTLVSSLNSMDGVRVIRVRWGFWKVELLIAAVDDNILDKALHRAKFWEMQ